MKSVKSNLLFFCAGEYHVIGGVEELFINVGCVLIANRRRVCKDLINNTNHLGKKFIAVILKDKSGVCND